MKQKILIAFDESENAKRAVEYVARVFKADGEITLFNVIPDIDFKCLLDMTSLRPDQFDMHDSLCRDMQHQKEEQLQISLQLAKNILLTAGFKEENVSTKSNRKVAGVARDIVYEAQKGYDLVVLGRTGMSAIKEFLMGSVTQKVLHALKDTSVLMVG